MSLYKFLGEDQRYLSGREKFADSIGKVSLWDTIDNWPLFVGISNLARSLSIAELLSETADVPGHVAEFGCLHGTNLIFLAKLLRIRDPWCAKIVHGFDTFESPTSTDENETERDDESEDRSPNKSIAENSQQLKTLRDVISLYQMDTEIDLHIGDISITLPALLEERRELSFSFVFCDVGRYKPTVTILHEIDERLSAGGLIILDQWNYENHPGETVAVREFLDATKSSYQPIHVKNTRQPSCCLKKAS
ncbi:MAG: TylF/MycF/NovP-related O-methyltransferase [Alphaproteobacteria bacterium]